jgi:hypothetical protein
MKRLIYFTKDEFLGFHNWITINAYHKDSKYFGLISHAQWEYIYLNGRKFKLAFEDQDDTCWIKISSEEDSIIRALTLYREELDR